MQIKRQDWTDPDVILGMRLMVERTPHSHADFPSYQRLLGHALARSYKKSGTLDDLEAALQHNHTALEHTGKDDPERAGRL